MLTALCRSCSIWSSLLVAISFVTSAAAFAQSTNDYARLIHPDVADLLGLDDAQRAKIQSLLQQRLDVQNQATPEKPADFATIDQQIRETLTPEQWKAWSETPPEQKLRFQFREQSWGDVLQWFARQDNLTLVMDRAPPGNFTYSDNRSYTPTEAVDLLNSVLLTKNFTLLRRDRMLTVIELTGEIPIELIPRIKLEELPGRGKFELVSVLFPLGKRPIDAVVTEVKPYLSTYGRVVPLAQSRQLLVIETAGKMQTINLLIASVPEPPPPQQPPPPPPPAPVPVFASYPLGNLDPQATLATIKKLIPSEQITVDDKTRVLSAFLVPAQQTAIQTAIAQMQKDTADSPELESFSYRVSSVDFEALQKQILAVAPTALVSHDKINSKVIVTAPPLDQAKIGKLLEAVGSPVVSTDMQLKAFQLLPAQSPAVTLALKSMLPNAQVLANDTTGTLIVRGSPADLLLAEEVFNSYKKKPNDADSQLKVYPLDNVVPATWLAQVAKAFPTSNLWLNGEQTQLLMLGSNDEHNRLEQMLPELKKLLPADEKRQVQIYTLTASQQQRWPLVETAAKAMIPNVTISPLTSTNELIVWGIEKDHQQLKGLLDQLQREEGSDDKVRWPKIYTLSMQPASLVLELVQKKFPEAKVSLADKDLTVWADQTTQLAIGDLLTQLKSEMPAELPVKLQTYSVLNMPVATLQSMLTEVIGKAKVIADATGNRLLVWADEETHRNIGEAVSQIAQLPPTDQEKVLVAYPLQHIDGVSLKTLLVTALPQAIIVVDAEGRQLIATASLSDQLRIKATVEQLDIPRAAMDAEEIRTYEMKNGLTATVLVPTLQTMWPKLKLTADSTNNQILATGPLKDHQDLKATLDRLFSSSSSEPIEAKTYEVPYGDLTTLPAILMQLAPKAVLSTDVTNRTILAWATASQHQRIEQAIEQLSQKSEGRQILQVYNVPAHRSPMVRLALTATFPTAAIGVDASSGQIIALATKEIQARIGDAVKQLLEAPEVAHTRTAKRYDIPKKFRATFPTLAASVSATITVATPATDLLSPLVLLATPQEHEQLEALAETLRGSEDLDTTNLVFRVYDLGNIDPAAFANLLSETRPTARVLSAPTATRIIIADSEAGHEAIEKLRSALEESYRQTVGLLFKIHNVRGDLITQLATIAATLAPTAKLFPNPAVERVVVIATQADQDKLATWITELDSQTRPANHNLQAYTIRKDLTTTATSLLASRFSTAKLIPTGDPTQFLIDATAGDHEQIAILFKELDEKTPQPAPTELKIYPLGGLDKTQATEVLTGALGTDVKIVTTTKIDELTILALPTAHQRVADTLQLLTESLTKVEGRKIELFPLDPNQADVTSVATSLRATVGTSTVLTPLIASNTLMVVGTTEQLEQVRKILQTLQEELPASQKRQSLVYAMKFADPLAAVRVLQSLVPKATLAADTVGRKLAATATPSEQQQIAEFIASYDKPITNERETKIYPLQRGSGRGLSFVVQEMLPNATVFGSREAPVLMATATPEDHEKIVKIIDEYNKTSGGDEVTTVITLKNAKAISAAQAVQQIDDLIKVTTDIPTNSLIITASTERTEQIQALLKQLESNEGFATVTKRYQLSGADPVALQRALAVSFPKATLAADAVNGDLYVTATEPEQLEIQKLVDSANQPSMRTSQVYALKYADPLAAVRVLASLLPKATLAPDVLGKKVAATASEAEHKQIAEFMISYDQPLSNLKETRIYQLKRGSGRGFSFALTEMLPTATIYGSRETPVVMATATVEDHEKIKAMIDQYNNASGGEEKTAVIALKKAQAETVADAVQQIDEEIRVSVDEATNTLIVTTSAEKILLVEALVKQIEDTAVSGIKTVSYLIVDGDATSLARALTLSFPKARISADAVNGRIYASATDVEHEEIRQLVDTLRPEGTRSTQVFRLGRAEADVVAEAIANLGSAVMVTADDNSNSVIVTAPEAVMSRVAEMVKQVDGTSGSAVVTKSYALEEADPTALQRALRISFPRTTISADDTNGTLYVTATDAEHLEIEQLIESTNQSLKRKPTLKTFMLKHSSAADVARALEEAFGRRSTVGISFDENTGALFVVGTPDDLVVADQVVQQMDVMQGEGKGRKLKVFSLSGADGDAIVASVEALFPDSYPAVKVSWDTLKEQLVVIGTTEQLAEVDETLKQFAPPSRELEIFHLRNSDPNTVQTAINALFADEPFATSPTVNKDEANSQILVRGTTEQLEIVRQLLLKMGETLTEQRPTALRGRVRNVVIQRDSEALLQQLQKVWPQVRNNPLEVVRLPETPTTTEATKDNQPKLENQEPLKTNAIDDNRPSRGPNAEGLQEAAPQPAQNAESSPKQQLPPVVVIPGDRQWTIASEDIAALDQFEALLEAGLKQPVLPVAATGNYSVYMLRHADAEDLEQLFTTLFRRGSTGASSGFASSSLLRTTFVADTRINALVVYGGNADRGVIEELLGVLDTDELINQLQLEAPTLISVENTDAQRVLDVLTDVYNNQLTSDGGRKPLTIPEGISSDVATILQQINAETEGPILTLGVETTSNSIVLRAPAELSREIADFIRVIDQRAGDQRSRQIQVIKLRESKSEQIEDALQMLLRSPRQGRQ